MKNPGFSYVELLISLCLILYIFTGANSNLINIKKNIDEEYYFSLSILQLNNFLSELEINKGRNLPSLIDYYRAKIKPIIPYSDIQVRVNKPYYFIKFVWYSRKFENCVQDSSKGCLLINVAME